MSRRDDVAVSEIVGSVMLVAISVVVLAGFGALVLSSVTSEGNEPPAASFSMSPEAGQTSVDVSFVSGEPFAISDARVVLTVDGAPTAGASSVVSTATDGRFHPGDTLQVALSGGALVAGDELHLLVVDIESGKPIGMAYATIPSASTLPAYVANAPDVVSSSLSPSPLVADGVELSSLAVRIDSSRGLALVASVTADLTSIGGSADALLLDDGKGGDAVAGDGVYTISTAASGHAFSSSHLAETVSITITVTDVLGHEATETVQVSLVPAEPPALLMGSSYGPIPSSAQLGWLNVTGFSFKGATSAIDSDQAVVRVRDTATTGLAWEATVKLDDCGGGRGVTQVVMTIDGVSGSSTWTPAGGCFLLDDDAQVDLANLDESRDAGGSTVDWTPTNPGFDYQDAGISGDNLVSITFFGDTVSLAPSATGLGEADLNWGPLGTAMPSAPQSLVATPGNKTASLSWAAPSSAGSSPITDYNVYRDGSLIGTTNAATLSFGDSGLTNGQEYDYTVRAVSAAGIGTSTPVASATPAAIPWPPEALIGTPGATAATLSWTPASNEGSALTGYSIFLNNSTTALATTNNGGNTSFVVNGLTNGATYTFSVAATNPLGTSAVSNLVHVIPSAVPVAPGAPQSLAVTNGSGAGTLTFSWAAPASDGGSPITLYNVWRSTDGATYALVASPGAATTTHQDTGLAAGVTRYYKVAAVNAAGVGPNATAVSESTWNVPGAPANLAVTNSTGAGTLAVTWDAPADDGGAAVTLYNVWRSADGVSFSLVASPAGTAYTDSALGAGVTRYYKVAAVNPAGVSANTSAVSETTWSLPTAPQGLAVSNSTGPGVLALSWSAPASNGGASVTAYDVWRSTDGVTFTRLASTASTAYSDTGLGTNVQRHYKVAAINVVGVGPNGTSAQATTWNVPTVPQSLAVSNSSAAGTLSLSWSAPSSNGGAAVTVYNVWRSTDGVTFTMIASPTGTSYSDPGLGNNAMRHYKVAAVNAAGVSANATAVSATTWNVPGAPTGLGATPGSAQVSLSWSAPTNNGGAAVTDYTVTYGTSCGALTSSTSVGSATASKVVAGLTNGVSYCFAVAAVNAAGTGAASATTTATPAAAGGTPSAPLNPGATPANNQITIDWTTPTSNGGSAITGYKIYRGTTSGGQGSTPLATTTNGANTTFTDKTALNNVTYYYTVRAYNANGDGTMSSEASAMPSSNVNINCSTFGASGFGSLTEACTALQFGGAWGNITETGTGGSDKQAIFDFTMNVTGITGTQTLEIRGERNNAPENLLLQAFNPSTSTYVTIVTLPSSTTSQTTFSGSISMATYASNGVLSLRLRDAGADSNNSSWIVDFVRLVTT